MSDLEIFGPARSSRTMVRQAGLCGRIIAREIERNYAAGREVLSAETFRAIQRCQYRSAVALIMADRKASTR